MDSDELGTGLRPLVFVVSGGRTGTVALAQYFAASFPEIHAVNEPAPAWGARIASSRFYAGRLPLDALATRLRRWRRRQLDAVPQWGYLESNASLWGCARALPLVFHEPTLVHVVRDPRTYVTSVLNHGSFSGVKALANALVPYWVPRPEYLDSSHGTWSRFTPYQKAAWLWATMNGEILRSAPLYGNRYIRVRFEELFHPSGDALVELAGSLGLAQPERIRSALHAGPVNAARGSAFPKWPAMSEDDRQSVIAICAETMALIGYQ